MVTRVLVLLAIVASCSPRITPPPPPLRPDPSEALLDLPPLPPLPEERLPRTFTPLRYVAALDVDPARLDFTGRIEITGTLAEATNVVWLHAEELLIQRVTASRPGDSPRPIAGRQPSRSLLALHSPTALAAGEWTFSIEYSGRWRDTTPEGGFRQNHGKTRAPYIFTQFEADYARMVFPCVDEPDRKTPWQLTITAPKELMVASNAPAASTTTTATTQTVTFAPTLPLPSYLVAFAVGPFEIVDGGRTKSGIPVRILTLHDRRDRTKYAATVTADIVDKIEAWLGIPFPYPKLDVVVVPQTTHWWFAMENPGLVTIDSSALWHQATWNHTMAHEIAHHWFGDLVTLAWWDDLWLNEAFAEWVGMVATKGEPPVHQMHTWAGAIRTRVTALSRPFSSGGARDNGPALLSRFAKFLGVDTLRGAIKHYLAAHSHGTVTTDDFASALEVAAGGPTASLFVSYLDARPSRIRTQLDCTGKRPRVTVTSSAGTEQIVCVAYDDGGTRADVCQLLPAADSYQAHSFELGTKKCPRWFLGENLERDRIPDLLEHAWHHLRTSEQEAIFETANTSAPEAILPMLVRSTSWVDTRMLGVFVAQLIEARAQLDDADLRKRFDAWLGREFNARAKLQPLTGMWDVAMLAVLGGEPTVVEQARVLAASHEPGARHASRLLAHTDAGYAGTLLANLSKVERMRHDDYRFALEGSPFIADLLESDPARYGADTNVLYLLRWTCNRSYAEQIDLIRKLSPDASDSLIRGITDPTHHASCLAKHKATADAVRKVLDGKERKQRTKR